MSSPDRRQFLGLATTAAATGSFLWAKNRFLPGVLNLPERPKAPQGLKAVDNIKAFEDEQGDRPLTFQRATKILPDIIQLHITNTKSPLYFEDTLNSTFIIHGQAEIPPPALFSLTKRDPDGRPLKENVKFGKTLAPLVNLQRDYPDLELTDEVVTRVLYECAIGLGGSAGNSQTFLNLDVLNNISTLPNAFQFKTMESETECKVATPTAIFVNTGLHETFHRDGPEEPYPLSPSALVDIQEIYGNPQNTSFFQRGLNINSFTPIQGSEPAIGKWGYEEFSADYSAATVAIKSGLQAVPDYTYPNDLCIFSKLLMAADISNDDLYRLHRLGAGAGEEISGRIGMVVADNHPTGWGLRLSEMMMQPPRANWKDIKTFFPKLEGFDTEMYAYVVDPRFDYRQPESARNGCVPPINPKALFAIIK